MVCGVFTLVAYKYWRKSHALHHAHTNDLGDRGHGDVWTMTVDEYVKATIWKKAAYRVFRNPFFLFGIAPGIHFIILQRLPLVSGEEYQVSDRRSVWWNNLAILILYSVLAYFIGLESRADNPTAGSDFGRDRRYLALLCAASVRRYLLGIQARMGLHLGRHARQFLLPVAQSAPMVHRQHRFPSHPSPDPRIPNYNLERCHKDNPELQRVMELTITNSLHTAFLTLWDEEQKKLVRFRDLKHLRSTGAAA